MGGAGESGNGAGSDAGGMSGASGGGAGLGGTPSGNGGGGGRPIASCDNVTACGGDVVGTYTVTSSCLTLSGVVDLSDSGLGCRAVPTTGSLNVTGTLSASAAGMTISDDTTTSGDATVEMQPECANTSALVVQCASLGRPLEALLGYASVACVDSESAWCTCSVTFNQAGGMGSISTSPITSGSYTTLDNVLTVSDGSSETEYWYCSTGSTLMLSLKSVGKTGTVTGTIVLERL
jgi:hypothetical protein